MQTISDKLGPNQYGTILVTCHDCGKDFEISLKRTGETSLEVDGGIIAKNLKMDEHLFKCLNCHEKDPYNYGSNCEVYSRVVGYLRPVSNWNDAKREEFGRRVNYKIA